jgi:outer membrane protein OmpA-like peptidoglycan-associated protein
VISASLSDPADGNFLVVVPLFVNMALNVHAPGYLFFSENFHYIDHRDIVDPHLRDIALQAVRAGESVVLRNVFFDTGSYQLKPESEYELNRLANLLMDNQSIHIEVGGHTDNTGELSMNQILSENRAKQVVEYLTGRGIGSDRMSYKGYADTQPIDTNDTDAGRAKNRRTTFTILKP